MKVLILAQSAANDDIRIITKALPNDTEYILLSGSDISFPNVKVVKTAPHDARSLFSRLKCWFQYRRDVLKWAKRERAERFDLIYANSNPPINSFLGLKLKKKFGAPFVYMNWDIYPQIIEETYPNIFVKAICRFWHRRNSKTYPQIDQVMTIAPVMAESINAPLKKKISIDIAPIASDPDRLLPVPKDKNIFLKENGLDGKFIVLYSGKLGYGHNISAILDAAKILQENHNITFVFIGKGPRCEEVTQAIKGGATNVRLFPFQPEEMFKHSIACGDVGIVSQDERLAHLFLPSKTYSLMSCGTPVIAMCSERDDLKTMLEHGGGIAIPGATPAKIADAILALYSNAELLNEMGKTARHIIETQYAENAVAQKYKLIFEKAMSGENK